MVQKEIFALCVCVHSVAKGAGTKNTFAILRTQNCNFDEKFRAMRKFCNYLLGQRGFTQRICNFKPFMKFDENRIVKQIKKLRHWKMQLLLMGSVGV